METINTSLDVFGPSADWLINLFSKDAMVGQLNYILVFVECKYEFIWHIFCHEFFSLFYIDEGVEKHKHM